MLNIDLSINNFYAFLIELSFSFLFLVLFASIHYNLTKSNKFVNLLTKKKWFNFLYFFFFGAILAMLAFVVSQLVSNSIDIQIGLPAVILGLIFAMSFFYSNSIQIGATIPAIFWVLVQYDGFSTMSTTCWIRLVYVCIFCLVSFGLGFYKEKKWLIFILGNIALAGTYLFLLIWTDDYDWVIQIIEACAGIITSLFFFAICKWLNKMFSNITSMSKKAIYTDTHFIIPSLLNERFNEFVKNNNNTKQIMVFTLESKDLNNPQTIDLFAQELNKALWEEHVLFIKTSNDKFGFVIADDKCYLSNIELSSKGNMFKKRIDLDPLSKIERILEKIPTEYTINGKTVKAEVKYYLSIYGIHSYDIDELLSFNQFMINNEDLQKSNLIKIFNSNMINHITNDKISYAALTQQINLNEIDVELEEIHIKNTRQTYVCPRFYWTRKLTCDVESIMSEFDKQTANTLLRCLAVRSIELYERSEFKNKNKLIIYYPIDELTSSFFSAANIIKKLRLYGLSQKNVIFSFSCKEVRSWPYRTLKHLKEFEKHKLNYFLVDVVNTTCFKNLKPQMVILSSAIENNKKNLKKAIAFSKRYNQKLLLTK